MTYTYSEVTYESDRLRIIFSDFSGYNELYPIKDWYKEVKSYILDKVLHKDSLIVQRSLSKRW